MKDVFCYELDGKKYEYHVKDDVAFADLIGAIECGFTMCFADDDSYRPELFEFAKEYVILSTLTDIEMPDSVNDAYKIIRAIDGVCSVDADFILDGMMEKARFYEKMFVASVADISTRRIADAIDTFVSKSVDIMHSLKSIVDDLGDQMKDGDLGDVHQLLNALTEMKQMSPEDMVSGMLAYNKSQKNIHTKKKTTKKVAVE